MCITVRHRGTLACGGEYPTCHQISPVAGVAATQGQHTHILFVWGEGRGELVSALTLGTSEPAAGSGPHSPRSALRLPPDTFLTAQEVARDPPTPHLALNLTDSGIHGGGWPRSHTSPSSVGWVRIPCLRILVLRGVRRIVVRLSRRAGVGVRAVVRTHRLCGRLRRLLGRLRLLRLRARSRLRCRVPGPRGCEAVAPRRFLELVDHVLHSAVVLRAGGGAFGGGGGGELQ